MGAAAAADVGAIALRVNSGAEILVKLTKNSQIVES